MAQIHHAEVTVLDGLAMERLTAMDVFFFNAGTMISIVRAMPKTSAVAIASISYLPGARVGGGERPGVHLARRRAGAA
jgi:hypothetical protein